MSNKIQITTKEWQIELDRIKEEQIRPNTSFERSVTLRQSREYVNRQILRRKKYIKQKIKDNVSITYWNVMSKGASKEASIKLFNGMIDKYFSQGDISLEEHSCFKHDIESIFTSHKTRSVYEIE